MTPSYINQKEKAGIDENERDVLKALDTVGIIDKKAEKSTLMRGLLATKVGHAILFYLLMCWPLYCSFISV